MNLRIPSAFLATGTLVLMLVAAANLHADDETKGDAPASDGAAPPADADVVARLFEEHATPASFTDAIREAREAGVSPQVITEAEMVHYLFRKTDIAGVRKTLLRIDEIRPTFDPKKSRVFKTKREFEAMAEYAKALIALTNGDEAALKEHITEAFWLDPGHASAFGNLVQGFRARSEGDRDGTETTDADADGATATDG